MAIIKLKQSDIENMVKQTIVNEQYWNEETEAPMEEEAPLDQPEEPGNQPAKTLSMMAGDDGNYYVVDWTNPDNPIVVAQTHK
jgi:hypothetical protein